MKIITENGSQTVELEYADSRSSVFCVGGLPVARFNETELRALSAAFLVEARSLDRQRRKESR